MQSLQDQVSFESGNRYGSYVSLISEFRYAILISIATGNSKLLRSEVAGLGVMIICVSCKGIQGCMCSV